MTSIPSTQAQTGSVKTATPAAGFSHRLTQVAETVETFLVERLGPEVGSGEIARPPRLMEAMRHAVLGGGKRLRPFLAIETARMLGGSEAAALAAGAGVSRRPGAGPGRRTGPGSARRA